MRLSSSSDSFKIKIKNIIHIYKILTLSILKIAKIFFDCINIFDIKNYTFDLLL